MNLPDVEGTHAVETLVLNGATGSVAENFSSRRSLAGALVVRTTKGFVAFWLDSGKLAACPTSQFTRECQTEPSIFSDPESRSPLASLQDIGLLEQGVILTHRSDGTAVAVVAPADSKVEMLWDFADAVRILQC